MSNNTKQIEAYIPELNTWLPAEVIPKTITSRRGLKHTSNWLYMVTTDLNHSFYGPSTSFLTREAR